MRKAIYASDAAEGRGILARAPVIQLATTTATGRPILRVLHAVIDEDLVAFHGAPVGEKIEGLGRHAVLSAHETVAEIPSWFLDPERACPATTYFTSVQVEGRLEEITDPARKARILARLMTKYQPSGGYRALDHTDPLYTKALDGLLVAGVPIDAIACKAKLGQNRKPEDRRLVVTKLWERGDPGDVAAVDLLLRRFPELTPASFVRDGYHLGCGLDAADLAQVETLLGNAYWLANVTVAEKRRAIASSSVVTARNDTGAIVAFARVISDGLVAWSYDVIVAPEERGRGLGSWLFGRLLDHPVVRHSRSIRLSTRDAMALYARFGFTEVAQAQIRPGHVSTMMIRQNGSTPSMPLA